MEKIKENWFKVAVVILMFAFIVIYTGKQQSESSYVSKLKPVFTPTTTTTEPKKNIVPVNDNLDSTCLSFYEKMKALDVPPIKTTPTYTPAELQAIQDTYAGNYNPNTQSIWAKQREAEDLYQNTIKGNAIQKENLTIKYGFCYEYLSKTYGFIIN